LRKDIIYSEGFLQILTIEDSLGLDYAILDEIMNVLECVVEDSLWEFLVLLGSKTGGEGGRSKLAAGEFGNGYHCPVKLVGCDLQENFHAGACIPPRVVIPAFRAV
jgi:hypothetical protein